MNKRDIQVLMRRYRNCYSLKVVIETILELIYPNTCVMCGKYYPSGVCQSCRTSNPLIREPRCMCCGKPIESYEKEYCNDCVEGRKNFTQGTSLWVHKGNVKQSIYRFKFKNHRIYAKEYARLFMQEHLELIEAWKPEAILPIPVHNHRRRVRGYNQAEVLAKAVQKEIWKELGIEIPIIEGVKRRKETIYQKKLDNRQRKKNLKNAFIIGRNVSFPQRILIVDDIYTTGATLQEVSRLLRKSGVDKVYFVTISIGQGF